MLRKNHMRRIRFGLVVLVLILIAAGCGTEESSAPSTETPLPTQGPTATPTPIPPTATPFVPSPLPPTWTPAQTATLPPARPTIEYTYERPTATVIIYPTYTPSSIPPSATPAGPLITITADQINQALDQELAGGSGGFFLAPPQIVLQEGLALVAVDVLTTPGSASTARSATLQFALRAQDGRLSLKKLRTFFDDTNAVYDDELVDNILASVEQTLTTMLLDQVGDARFSVSDIVITPAGIAVQTTLIP